MAMTNQRIANDVARLVAYVTLQDATARATIVSALARAGWAVIPQPTGFHLIQAIAGVIEGDYAWLRPGLIVIDARSRGCAGTTIAAGLRDLGITIPIVLVVAPGEAPPVSPDDTLRIVTAASAPDVVAELAHAGAAPVAAGDAAAAYRRRLPVNAGPSSG